MTKGLFLIGLLIFSALPFARAQNADGDNPFSGLNELDQFLTQELSPLEHTTWADWHGKHPQTTVLSQRTGHNRDYARDPYGDYEQKSRIFFPVAHEDPRLTRKAWVLGVIVNGRTKAYPFQSLAQAPPPLEDEVGGQKIWIDYDSQNQSAVVKDGRGEIIPSVQAYWFAWAAFYPETALYNNGGEE